MAVLGIGMQHVQLVGIVVHLDKHDDSFHYLVRFGDFAQYVMMVETWNLKKK